MTSKSSDIFLSYATQDRSLANMLVKIFQAQGWSVYWDREVLPGDNWVQELRSNLDAANCIVVLWSKNSSQSDYVMKEATIALEHNKLIPVTIDGTIPKAFNSIFAVSIVDWKGDSDNKGIQQLLRAIHERLVGPEAKRGEDLIPDEKRVEPILMEPILELKGHEGEVTAITFHPDGRRIATSGYDQTVRIWNIPSGNELMVLEGHTATVNTVAFSPDGRILVSGSQDKSIRVWDIDTGKQLAIMSGHEETIGSVSFHPNGNVIVSSSSDGTIRIWNIRSSEMLRVIKAHEGKTYAAIFSPDGHQIATCGIDLAVRIWDFETGQQILEYLYANEPALSLAYSPNERYLVAGGKEGDLRLFDPKKLVEIASLHEHRDGVTSVTFNDDGKLLASVSYDSLAVIWNVDTLTNVRFYGGSGPRLKFVEFSPEGEQLSIAGEDGLALILSFGDKQLHSQLHQSSQVKWLADEAAKQDMLNRGALAGALADRLQKFHDDPEFEGMSFLIHIDGPWGSGKTTLMDLLKGRLTSGEHSSEWQFVAFDAWRQSHVGPPWWALLTHLRQAVGSERTWKQHMRLWWAELWERIRRSFGLRYIMTLSLTLLVCLIVLLYIIPDDFSWKALEDNVGGLTAAAGIVIAVWGGATLVSKFAFWHSAAGAKIFERSHENPMQAVAVHYTWLMRYSGKTTVFLIDDLDRCPSTYVVGLLDAVQTLMRKAEAQGTNPKPCPAYFIVAADGRWIRQSYEIAFKDFIDAIDEPGRPLGYLFLDKLFQITVRVPLMSPELRDSFLRQLLQVESKELSDDLEKEEAHVLEKIKQSSSEEEAVKAVREAQPIVQHRVAAEVVRKLTSEKLQRTTEHKLQKFAPLLDPNPRSMKRFIMAYSLSRSILSLEGNWVETETLALWTILQLRWPELAERLRKHPHDIEFVNPNTTAPKSDKLRDVFVDYEVRRVVKFTDGGPLTEDKIKKCCVRGQGN